MATQNAINFPVLNESDLVSNSATSVPTQQSVKTYIDNQINITRYTISSAFIDIPLSTGIKYDIALSGIIPDEDNVVIFLKTSSNGGTSYDDGASDYGFDRNYVRQATSTTAWDITADDADNNIVLMSNIGNDTNEGFSGLIYTINPAGAYYTQFFSNLLAYRGNNNDWHHYFDSGIRYSTDAVNAIRILHNGTTGQFTSGIVDVIEYGAA